MVLDEQGEPIIGANIVEKGTTNGTITDIDGNYTLTLNDLKKAVLQFSFIGYNTLEEGVKGRNKVDVKLAPSVVNLGEVVAIGYGTQTRKEITGSVANVSEENFNKGVNRDASDLLQGKVAGLQITSGSGDVTRSSQIRLRGTSTLQNDQGPMIVIDGVPGVYGFSFRYRVYFRIEGCLFCCYLWFSCRRWCYLDYDQERFGS